MIDLNTLSLSQLRDLQTEVGVQIEARRQQDVLAVRQQIATLAESVGMTVEEIMNVRGGQAKKQTKSVAARYQSPDNPELQWTGRGRQPAWVKEHLKAGKDLQSLTIQPK